MHRKEEQPHLYAHGRRRRGQQLRHQHGERCDQEQQEQNMMQPDDEGGRILPPERESLQKQLIQRQEQQTEFLQEVLTRHLSSVGRSSTCSTDWSLPTRCSWVDVCSTSSFGKSCSKVDYGGLVSLDSLASRSTSCNRILAQADFPRASPGDAPEGTCTFGKQTSVNYSSVGSRGDGSFLSAPAEESSSAEVAQRAAREFSVAPPPLTAKSSRPLAAAPTTAAAAALNASGASLAAGTAAPVAAPAVIPPPVAVALDATYEAVIESSFPTEIHGLVGTTPRGAAVACGNVSAGYGGKAGGSVDRESDLSRVERGSDISVERPNASLAERVCLMGDLEAACSESTALACSLHEAGVPPALGSRGTESEAGRILPGLTAACSGSAECGTVSLCLAGTAAAHDVASGQCGLAESGVAARDEVDVQTRVSHSVFGAVSQKAEQLCEKFSRHVGTSLEISRDLTRSTMQQSSGCEGYDSCITPQLCGSLPSLEHVFASRLICELSAGELYAGASGISSTEAFDALRETLEPQPQARPPFESRQPQQQVQQQQDSQQQLEQYHAHEIRSQPAINQEHSVHQQSGLRLPPLGVAESLQETDEQGKESSPGAVTSAISPRMSEDFVLNALEAPSPSQAGPLPAVTDAPNFHENLPDPAKEKKEQRRHRSIPRLVAYQIVYSDHQAGDRKEEQHPGSFFQEEEHPQEEDEGLTEGVETGERRHTLDAESPEQVILQVRQPKENSGERTGQQSEKHEELPKASGARQPEGHDEDARIVAGVSAAIMLLMRRSSRSITDGENWSCCCRRGRRRECTISSKEGSGSAACPDGFRASTGGNHEKVTMAPAAATDMSLACSPGAVGIGEADEASAQNSAGQDGISEMDTEVAREAQRSPSANNTAYAATGDTETLCFFCSCFASQHSMRLYADLIKAAEDLNRGSNSKSSACSSGTASKAGDSAHGERTGEPQRPCCCWLKPPRRKVCWEATEKLREPCKEVQCQQTSRNLVQCAQQHSLRQDSQAMQQMQRLLQNSLPQRLDLPFREEQHSLHETSGQGHCQQQDQQQRWAQPQGQWQQHDCLLGQQGKVDPQTEQSPQAESSESDGDEDDDPLTVFHSVLEPSISPEAYSQRLARFTHCSPCCFLFALIYICRLLVSPLTATAVRCSSNDRDDSVGRNSSRGRGTSKDRATSSRDNNRSNTQEKLTAVQSCESDTSGTQQPHSRQPKLEHQVAQGCCCQQREEQATTHHSQPCDASDLLSQPRTEAADVSQRFLHQRAFGTNCDQKAEPEQEGQQERSKSCRQGCFTQVQDHMCSTQPPQSSGAAADVQEGRGPRRSSKQNDKPEQRERLVLQEEWQQQALCMQQQEDLVQLQQDTTVGELRPSESRTGRRRRRRPRRCRRQRRGGVVGAGNTCSIRSIGTNGGLSELRHTTHVHYAGPFFGWGSGGTVQLQSSCDEQTVAIPPQQRVQVLSAHSVEGSFTERLAPSTRPTSAAEGAAQKARIFVGRTAADAFHGAESAASAPADRAVAKDCIAALRIAGPVNAAGCAVAISTTTQPVSAHCRPIGSGAAAVDDAACAAGDNRLEESAETCTASAGAVIDEVSAEAAGCASWLCGKNTACGNVGDASIGVGGKPSCISHGLDANNSNSPIYKGGCPATQAMRVCIGSTAGTLAGSVDGRAPYDFGSTVDNMCRRTDSGNFQASGGHKVNLWCAISNDGGPSSSSLQSSSGRASRCSITTVQQVGGRRRRRRRKRLGTQEQPTQTLADIQEEQRFLPARCASDQSKSQQHLLSANVHRSLPLDHFRQKPCVLPGPYSQKERRTEYIVTTSMHVSDGYTHGEATVQAQPGNLHATLEQMQRRQTHGGIRDAWQHHDEQLQQQCYHLQVTQEQHRKPQQPHEQRLQEQGQSQRRRCRLQKQQQRQHVFPEQQQKWVRMKRLPQQTLSPGCRLEQQTEGTSTQDAWRKRQQQPVLVTENQCWPAAVIHTVRPQFPEQVSDQHPEGAEMLAWGTLEESCAPSETGQQQLQHPLQGGLVEQSEVAYLATGAESNNLEAALIQSDEEQPVQQEQHVAREQNQAEDNTRRQSQQNNQCGPQEHLQAFEEEIHQDVSPEHCTKDDGVSRQLTGKIYFHVTAFKAHRLLLTAVTVAAKFFDDTYYANSYYARTGGIQTAELNRLEIAFLRALDYRLCVHPTDFERCKRAVLLLGNQMQKAAAGTAAPRVVTSDYEGEPCAATCIGRVLDSPPAADAAAELSHSAVTGARFLPSEFDEKTPAPAYMVGYEATVGAVAACRQPEVTSATAVVASRNLTDSSAIPCQAAARAGTSYIPPNLSSDASICAEAMLCPAGEQVCHEGAVAVGPPELFRQASFETVAAAIPADNSMERVGSGVAAPPGAEATTTFIGQPADLDDTGGRTGLELLSRVLEAVAAQDGVDEAVRNFNAWWMQSQVSDATTGAVEAWRRSQEAGSSENELTDDIVCAAQAQEACCTAVKQEFLLAGSRAVESQADQAISPPATVTAVMTALAGGAPAGGDAVPCAEITICPRIEDAGFTASDGDAGDFAGRGNCVLQQKLQVFPPPQQSDQKRHHLIYHQQHHQEQQAGWSRLEPVINAMHPVLPHMECMSKSEFADMSLECRAAILSGSRAYSDTWSSSIIHSIEKGSCSTVDRSGVRPKYRHLRAPARSERKQPLRRACGSMPCCWSFDTTSAAHTLKQNCALLSSQVYHQQPNSGNLPATDVWNNTSTPCISSQDSSSRGAHKIIEEHANLGVLRSEQRRQEDALRQLRDTVYRPRQPQEEFHQHQQQQAELTEEQCQHQLDALMMQDPHSDSSPSQEQRVDLSESVTEAEGTKKPEERWLLALADAEAPSSLDCCMRQDTLHACSVAVVKAPVVSPQYMEVTGVSAAGVLAANCFSDGVRAAASNITPASLTTANKDIPGILRPSSLAPQRSSLLNAPAADFCLVVTPSDSPWTGEASTCPRGESLDCSRCSSARRCAMNSSRSSSTRSASTNSSTTASCCGGVSIPRGAGGSVGGVAPPVCGLQARGGQQPSPRGVHEVIPAFSLGWGGSLVTPATPVPQQPADAVFLSCSWGNSAYISLCSAQMESCGVSSSATGYGGQPCEELYALSDVALGNAGRPQAAALTDSRVLQTAPAIAVTTTRAVETTDLAACTTATTSGVLAAQEAAAPAIAVGGGGYSEQESQGTVCQEAVALGILRRTTDPSRVTDIGTNTAFPAGPAEASAGCSWLPCASYAEASRLLAATGAPSTLPVAAYQRSAAGNASVPATVADQQQRLGESSSSKHRPVSCGGRGNRCSCSLSVQGTRCIESRLAAAAARAYTSCLRDATITRRQDSNAVLGMKQHEQLQRH